MKKHIIWIIIFLVLTCICFTLILNQDQGNIAVIKSNGKVIKEINLDMVKEPYEFNVEYNGETNTIRIENAKICVSHASCPDKLCISQGYAGNIPVVCLPNKLSITVTDGEFDAAT